MAVSITQPKSTYLNLTITDTTLQWETNVSGQTAYEVLYKKKMATEWSTLGKVDSTSCSVDLKDLYNAVNLDFEEFYYRVLLYYSFTQDTETVTGKEYSDVYSIIFNQGYGNVLNVSLNGIPKKYPIFEKVNNTGIPYASIGGGVGKIPIVGDDSPLSEEENGKRHFASGRANFKPSGIYGNGEFDVSSLYYTPVYAYQQDAVYAYDRSTNYAYQKDTNYAYKYLQGANYTSYVTGSTPTSYTRSQGTNYYYYSYNYIGGYYTVFQGYTVHYYVYSASRQVSNRHTAYYITGSRIYGYAGSGGGVRYGYTNTYGSYTETSYGYYRYTEYSIRGYSKNYTYAAGYNYRYTSGVQNYYYYYSPSSYSFIYGYKISSYYYYSERYISSYSYRSYISGYSYYSYIRSYNQTSYISQYNTTNYSYKYYT